MNDATADDDDGNDDGGGDNVSISCWCMLRAWVSVYVCIFCLLYTASFFFAF